MMTNILVPSLPSLLVKACKALVPRALILSSLHIRYVTVTESPRVYLQSSVIFDIKNDEILILAGFLATGTHC